MLRSQALALAIASAWKLGLLVWMRQTKTDKNRLVVHTFAAVIMPKTLCYIMAPSRLDIDVSTDTITTKADDPRS